MKKIYHGSQNKISVFNAYSFDLGNTFQKAGWSTFCFKDYEYTKKFAIMRMIQNLYKERKSIENIKFLNKNRCTWDFIYEQPITTKKGYEFILNNFVNQKIYIHTIDCKKIKKIGIGNDITHDEFTFRDNDIKPIKIDEIVLTEELLKNSMLIVQDVNVYREKLVELSQKYNRGFLSLFITFDYTINRKEIEKIINSIENGKLKVGENIAGYILENNIEIKKIPFFKRIEKAILGIIGRKFLREKYMKKLKNYHEVL